jgi:undecaprenyl-diphosphatase
MTFTSKTIATVALATIVLIAAFVGGPRNGLETQLMSWLAEHRAGATVAMSIASALTLAGSAFATLGTSAAAAIWLLLRQMPRHALLLAATVTCVRLFVDLLKDWVGRERPPLEHLPHSMAFPSGHSANSMTAYLVIAIVAIPTRYRPTAIVAALLVSIVIGLTRVLLGVHWPSDVIGGWALGIFAAGIAATIGERSASLRLEAKHDVVAGHRAALNKDQAS